MMNREEIIRAIMRCTGIPRGVTFEDLASVGVEVPPRKGWRKRWLKQFKLNGLMLRQYQPAMAAPSKVVQMPQPVWRRRIDLFYHSYEWADARYNALKRSNGCCELCGRGKIDGVVLNVDHIKPLRRYWELRTDPKNLQVLCAMCNKGKGNRDDTDWREQERDMDDRFKDTIS